MRIAMWSGPRNLSTAMMYSFANRGDFDVMDEPFYAAYLSATKEQHPMRVEIIEAQETDPNRVARECMSDRSPHLYMKHMSHHMLPGFPLWWARDCVNIHLIRHPARVISSYAKKREAMSFADIGYVQQLDLFKKLGGLIIDSADIRESPAAMMRTLCRTIGLEFDPVMLSWQAGPLPQDGIWGTHWYGAVHQSTGFEGAEGALPDLSPEQATLCARAMVLYKEMRNKRLRP